MRMSILTSHPVIDAILLSFEPQLGHDFHGYRNHVFRVLNFYLALSPQLAEPDAAVTIAAPFHDLGIWTAHTFDYLEPSLVLALSYLEGHDHPGVDPEQVRELIAQHHRIRPYVSLQPWGPCVESWRKADHVDVSLGILVFDLPRAYVREVRRLLPDHGFHLRLLTLTVRQFFRTPWNPLPMMRW